MKPKQTRDKAWYTRSNYKRALGNSIKLMSKHPFDKTMRNKYVQSGSPSCCALSLTTLWDGWLAYFHI